ncbi:MAG: hypothetical protein RR540_01765 [Oscillospiraceae bacterium]
MKKSKKYKAKIFAATMILCFVIFGFFYGFATVFVNGQATISEDVFTAIDYQRTKFNEAEISVFGEKFSLKIPEVQVPLQLYAAVPPSIRLVISGIEYLSEKIIEIF